MRTDIDKWDRSAKEYSEFESTSRYSGFCRDFVANRFQSIRGLDVLDAGCGNGAFTHLLSQNGGNVTGCDGSAEMLEIARETYPQYSFDTVDLLAGMPYETASFDIVFCNLVLMDIEPIDGVIQEFHRVLKENGIFFFSIVHPAFYQGPWHTNGMGIIDGKIVRGYLTVFSELQSAPWGETAHYHRPVSCYFNKISAAGFRLERMYEPSVYEDEKIPDIPLYLFAEFSKKVHI